MHPVAQMMRWLGVTYGAARPAPGEEDAARVVGILEPDEGGGKRGHPLRGPRQSRGSDGCSTG